MTQVALGNGLLFPQANFLLSTSNAATMDAATEKVAWIGRLYIDGRAASKTLSTGNIQFRTGTCTWANGSTTMDVGIQDVTAGAGPFAQPDGTFDVKTTLTGGSGLTSAAWNTITMTTGTKTISHGALIAIVFDMTARAGADSVVIAEHSTPFLSSGSGFPTTNIFVSSAWQTTFVLGAARLPNAIISFDDGTLGWLDFTTPASLANSADAYQDSTNPDERGMLFQVPFDCKVDAFWCWLSYASAAADFSIKLYSDPTGTPAALSTNAILIEQLGGPSGTNILTIFNIATPISLSRNTNYAVTLLATGTANVGPVSITLGNTAHRAAIPGGTTLAKVTRNNSTGAFTAESPAITMYGIGVRLSSFDDGGGAGGPPQLVNGQGLVG